MIETIIPIILAAGKGGRFKEGYKLIYNIDGKPLILKTLDPFLEFFKKIVVVIGFDSNNMTKILENIDSKIKINVNDNWEKGGMSSSIITAIKYISNINNCLGTLIHPGDIPHITVDDLEKIILKVKDLNYEKIVIPQFENKNGHPIYIPKTKFSEILTINEESKGLRKFVKNNLSDIIYVEVGKGILKDIDQKSDLLRESY